MNDNDDAPTLEIVAPKMPTDDADVDQEADTVRVPFASANAEAALA